MTARMILPAQRGLFGGVEAPRSHAPKFITEKAAGYAARPGTGPEGQSCGTCVRCRIRTAVHQGKRQKRFYKCDLMRPAWNTSRTTDVLLHSPACAKWEEGTPTECHSTLRRED